MIAAPALVTGSRSTIPAGWSSLRCSTSSPPGTCGTAWTHGLPHAPGIGCFWLWRSHFLKDWSRTIRNIFSIIGLPREQRRKAWISSARALAHYHAAYQDPTRIHAMCEDYRAGRSSDLEHDEADRAAGKKIGCPVLAL